MRELVLDTETTGLDHEAGHRLVEIGIVELENHIPTVAIFTTILIQKEIQTMLLKKYMA